MKNIVLVGYRCTGKTTVGKLLARRLGYAFVDTDELVVEGEGKTIAQMVEEEGWPYFRDRESEALARASEIAGAAVATGGGIVESSANRKLLRRMGLVICLTAPVDVIEGRMAEDPATATGRPALTAERDRRREIEQTLARRRPFYEEVADLAFDTAMMSPEEIVEAVCREPAIREGT